MAFTLVSSAYLPQSRYTLATTVPLLPDLEAHMLSRDLVNLSHFRTWREFSLGVKLYLSAIDCKAQHQPEISKYG